jgi:EAL domain-containing protein (putative c-di-GMP-specific phosphodiesterase class I)
MYSTQAEEGGGKGATAAPPWGPLKDLRRAIDGDELRCQYQPIVELEHGKVVAVEALVRWQHPRAGLLQPGAFIQWAEHSDLISDLGGWVLEEACARAADWRRQGCDLRLQVNVGMRQLLAPGFVSSVRRLVEKHRMADGQLVLELTEFVALERWALAALRVHQLHSLGVVVSLDDFGTGCSKVAQLRQLPVDQLKIDRTFVAGLAPGAANSLTRRQIVHALLGLAATFGLDVVAEGIEEQAQRSALLALGCLEGQGFLFSRPLDADAIVAFWAASARSSTVARCA